MKTYYQQMKPRVLNHLENFIEDFTKHDAKILCNYKGKFIHGTRKTGTDILLIDPLQDAINHLIQLKKTDFFTIKGLQMLLKSELIADDFMYCQAITYRDDLFHYGNNGKVIKVTKEQITKIIHDEIEKPLQSLKTHIKRDINVRNNVYEILMEEINKKAEQVV